MKKRVATNSIVKKELTKQVYCYRLNTRFIVIDKKEAVMEQLKLCDSDYRFMSVVWDYAPIPSGKLVKLCNEILGGKSPRHIQRLKNVRKRLH